MVTHEPDVGNRAKRIVRLKDGMIQSDLRLDDRPEEPPDDEIITLPDE